MVKKKSKAMTAEALLKLENSSGNIRLELGDMLQFDAPEAPRRIHHWGIYSGNGNFIHFTTHQGVSELLNRWPSGCKRF